MFVTHDPSANLLLAGLAHAERERVWRWLDRADLASGQTLHESGETYRYAYFPTTAIVSVQCAFRDGASVQAAMVGNEGMVGAAILLGGGSSPSRDVVLCAGEAFRMDAQALRREAARGEQLMALVLRHVQALIVQVTLTAACNRHHTVEQQLCRCLLLCTERRQSSEVALTQEVLAHAIGVRRETVTEAALRLQASGIISYSRGRITVLDPGGLQRRACDCHAVMKREYRRLLPSHPPVSASASAVAAVHAPPIAATAPMPMRMPVFSSTAPAPRAAAAIA